MVNYIGVGASRRAAEDGAEPTPVKKLFYLYDHQWATSGQQRAVQSDPKNLSFRCDIIVHGVSVRRGQIPGGIWRCGLTPRKYACGFS